MIDLFTFQIINAFTQFLMVALILVKNPNRSMDKHSRGDKAGSTWDKTSKLSERDLKSGSRFTRLDQIKNLGP